MPKVTIEFNLPEEQEEYKAAYSGSAYYNVIWELDQWLRSEVKYNNKEELDVVRDKLREILYDNEVVLP